MQTNGKLEKWNDTYEHNRFRFENFDNFMNWYNTVRFHDLDSDASATYNFPNRSYSSQYVGYFSY